MCFVLVFSPVYHCGHLAWGKESWSIYASRAFVCLSCMLSFLSFFSLPLSARGWPWHVIVAVLVLFYFFFIVKFDKYTCFFFYIIVLYVTTISQYNLIS